VPDAGEVRFEGRPVTREDRLRFGYMPEERGLYPGMVVREQLVYLARLHGIAPADAARATADLLARLGLADRAGDRVEALSLGNQQRVQLAAALVHDPVLLVLDEPFSGLDPAGVDALGEVLAERAAAGAGVLFSSHQLDLVEHLCQEVVIIDDGRAVAAGPVQVLTTSERHLEVEVDADPTWVQALPGVSVVRFDGHRVALELQDGTDPNTVLDAARAAGTVRHFSFERRRLSEVFRQAVGV
jgi:ABC-2 type transport system ATP-binding protein